MAEQAKEKVKGLPAKQEWEVQYKSSSGIEVRLTPSIIRKYLVNGRSELVTDQEIIYFMNICRARGLNPLIKDAYLIKYTGEEPAAIVTSIDFFRKRARAQKDCVGWRKGIIVKEKDGVKDSYGLLLEGQELVGGFFEATPEGWKVPFRLEVNLRGYLKKKKDGSLTRFWSEDNQPTMIAKIAEAQGLRTLWPDEFQQLYSEEETVQTDSMGNGAIDISPPGKTFDELALEKFAGNTPEDLTTFLKLVAENNKFEIDQAKTEAAKDFNHFIGIYEAWSARQPKLEPLSNGSEGDIPTPEEEQRALEGKGMVSQKPYVDLGLKGKTKK